MKSSDATQVMFIHLVLVLILPFLLFVFIGCSEPETENPDLGPELNQEEYFNKLDETLASYRPEDSKKGDFVEYENNVRIEFGSILKTDAIEFEIVDEEDLGDDILYDIRIKEVFWNDANNDPEVILSETNFTYPKNIPVVTPNKLFLSPSAVKALSPQATNDISYHNFSTRTEIRTPPDRVVNSGNCGNMPVCHITVTTFKYDIVIWKCSNRSNCPNSFEKIQIVAEYSPDVPFVGPNYMGGIINLCQAGITVINGTRYFAELCTVLRDFKFGI